MFIRSSGCPCLPAHGEEYCRAVPLFLVLFPETIAAMKKSRILLVESIHSVAEGRLVDMGHDVTLLPHAPQEDELCRLLPNYDVLGIRSKTEVSEKVLQSNPNLLAIGCFCIGTNQVDLSRANEFGVPVFNAPHSNTRSVAELVIAEMICLSRQLGDRSRIAHEGGWMKSADGSREVRGKTVGIVGYGHIGSQVSVMAESMGLKVLFYDVFKKLPIGNASATLSLDELLAKSDFVTLHVPETLQTKNMIGARELGMMKKGSYLINASRGTVVVINDLVQALKEKHLGGCAIDVFPIEPSSNKDKFLSPLQNLPNVLLTPHIGGSTEEAQFSIGLEVAESFIQFLGFGTTLGSVNFPQVDLPKTAGAHRLVNVHRNEPGVLGEINVEVSRYGANILAQTLSTDPKIGYLIMDVERADAKPLGEAIGKLKRSIRTQVLD